jgi:hypothetical protein
MNYLDKEIFNAIPAYLKPIEDIWQPADLLLVAACIGMAINCLCWIQV